MQVRINKWLVVGAGLSASAAAIHIGIVFVGASWYRFFGAGEEMAKLSEAGHWYPPVVTAAIAIVLFIWAAYALSGARMIRKLPLLRTALCIITAAYLLRGSVLLGGVWDAELRTPFVIWSSLVCLFFGVVHLIGLLQVWSGFKPIAA